MNPPDKPPTTAVTTAPPSTEPAPRNTQRASTADSLDSAIVALIRFFTSLRLTVVCLALGLVLVFFGTMAQDPLGLYLAQEKFFRSFFVTAPSMWAAIKKTLEMLHVYLPPSTAADVILGSRLPVFPGGYLIGGVLLLNLIASLKRYCAPRFKAGLFMVHFGLILLLLGQLGTDMLSRESRLHLREGEAKNYSESDRQVELAITDTTASDIDTVVAIPQPTLMRKSEIRNANLPFTVQVKHFYMNSQVEDRGNNTAAAPAATQGVGPRAVVKELPRVTALDQRDVPSAIIEIVTPQGSLGTWLVSEYINQQPQRFSFNNRSYDLTMRLRRYYKPYSLQLLKFLHDIYPGTDIPKNFASRVRLARPDTGESREVLIHMNSPLRYGGETYYQESFDPDDHGSVLQVVHNPSWLTPYLSCILVGLGLVVQFASHLLGFTLKRKGA